MINHVEKAAELLEKAAEILERDGWTRGEYQELDNTRRCAVGAIRHAALENACRRPRSISYRLAMEALATQAGAAHSRKESVTSLETSVIGWNDDTPNPFFESRILDGFKHAAKDLRNRATPQ